MKKIGIGVCWYLGSALAVALDLPPAEAVQNQLLHIMRNKKDPGYPGRVITRTIILTDLADQKLTAPEIYHRISRALEYYNTEVEKRHHPLSLFIHKMYVIQHFLKDHPAALEQLRQEGYFRLHIGEEVTCQSSACDYKSLEA